MAGINIGGRAVTSQFYLGSINFDDAPGDCAQTGLGFEPKFVLFFSNRYGSGVQLVDCVFSLGFATVDGQQVQAWGEERGAGPPTNAERVVRDDAVFLELVPPSGILSTGTFVSFDADGFTVNVDAIMGDVFFLAGSCNARSQLETLPSGGGSDTFTLPIDPAALLAFRHSTSESSVTNDARLGFGWATSVADQTAVGAGSEDAAATRDGSQLLQSGRVLSLCGAGASEGAWSVSTFAASLGIDNDVSGTSDAAFLALGGIQSASGTGTTPTTGSNPVTDAITGVGFQPKALLFLTVCETANAAVDGTDQQMMISAVCHQPVPVGNPEQQLVWFGGTPGPGTANVGVKSDATRMMTAQEDLTSVGGSQNIRGQVVSLDSDGFTIEWSGPDNGSGQIGGFSPPGPAYAYAWLALG